MTRKKATLHPKQHQKKQPGKEYLMHPKPLFEDENYHGSKKLEEKVAIITGGDSGIGRAVAIAYAKEGADIVIIYFNEHKDAHETKEIIEERGKRCLLIHGNVGDEKFCKKAVTQAHKEFGRLDILVNNAAIQIPEDDFLKITPSHIEKTFRINIFAYFFMAQAIVKYFKKGGVIINTTSVTAYRGSKHLIDYSATKGAIVAFTRSLSQSLIDKNIRVNGVAPGPIWTPLIPASFDADIVADFGHKAPMGRAGEPYEIAPSYVFLASNDSSYMSGQILHPNGGEVING